ncbi:MAG: asparagine synthase (glutamine-hydrolyzing) [Aerococcus sp.]|nr:asparagine synthase (glutamine-hydrolyzing) [Aerococcus sp.]
MCGFIGYINGNDGPLSDASIVLKDMMERIRHRGPDSDGTFESPKAMLGFRRLSIIDLTTAGDQPLYSTNRRYVMLFNGEIYNYRLLRKDLEEMGYTFNSNTDSEVIIRGFEAWGEDVIEKLRGMFAIAIWDTKEEQLFLARDMFGIKPLYYSNHTSDGSFLFGSEIKSFLDHPRFIKEVNVDALRPYMTFQYNPLDESFFKGVYKLKPAHYAWVKDGQITEHRYYMKQFDSEAMKNSHEPLETYVEHTKRIMAESVEAHKISDVQVGCFLSGGVDSSLITALAKPERTYSVGFEGHHEDKFDEIPYASVLAEQLGTNHKNYFVSEQETFDHLPYIIYMLDEPDANYSILPLYFLNRLAAQDVKVVLSGEGADELFAGYQWYYPSQLADNYRKLPLSIRKFLNALVPDRDKPGRLKSFLIRGVTGIEDRFIGHAISWPEDEVKNVLKPKYMTGPSVADITHPVYAEVSDQTDLQKMQYLDWNLWMPGDILLKADKMSMANSLELRVPFLDRKVFELAETLPDKYRASYHDSKITLREAAKDVLPDEWAKRPKAGFLTPLREWMRRDPFYSAIKEAFQSEIAEKLFNTEELLSVLERHKNGEDLGHWIYVVYAFLLWYQDYFVEDKGRCQMVDALA